MTDNSRDVTVIERQLAACRSTVRDLNLEVEQLRIQIAGLKRQIYELKQDLQSLSNMDGMQ